MSFFFGSISQSQCHFSNVKIFAEKPYGDEVVNYKTPVNSHTIQSNARNVALVVVFFSLLISLYFYCE